ncbi:MAG: YsnF/AvaK domain-containing protein [Ferruginibacter sp.]|nr:YsnF/AvaK domain-containing protein [Cytophagales bacterium]
MAQTVIGLFDSAAEAHQAVQQLLNQGFTNDDIDLSVQIVTGIGTSTTVAEDEGDRPGDRISHFFGSLFGASDESSTYSHVARQSGSLVTVHARSGEEAQRAAGILDDCGAMDVEERAAQYGYPGAAATDPATAEGAPFIPVIDERLPVGKRVVETGVTRLRSRIVERPVEEHVRLREERVRIERTAADRPATAADLANVQADETELIERAEVAMVTKDARVVEEVALGKEAEPREETIRDTVRRPEVDVENIDPHGPDGTRQ